MGMVISNRVKYYKTVEEAFAAANPSMRKFLCPQPGPADAARALVKKMEVLPSQDFAPENIVTFKDSMNALKSILVSKTGELKILEALDKCLNYISKGEIGEALFKMKLKTDKNFAQILSEAGFKA